MEWSDDAIVLSVRALGESGAIVEALTRTHGRHMGRVRGGASRRMKPVLQPGNTLRLVWRARLNEHLGSFAAEAERARAGELMEHRESLIGLNAFSTIAAVAMPERESHEPVFAAGEILLDAMLEDGVAHWGPLYVRWGSQGCSMRSASASISPIARQPVRPTTLSMYRRVPGARCRAPAASRTRNGSSRCHRSCSARRTRLCARTSRRG